MSHGSQDIRGTPVTAAEVDAAQATMTPRDRHTAAHARLRDMLHLAAGRMPGAAAIDPLAVATAGVCVDLLAALGDVTPYVFPTPDGGVSLEWDAPDRPDVRIAPDGAVGQP